MIISEKFVIGHIPKTGGHALAVMLDKVPNLEFQSPLEIHEGRAKIVDLKRTLHIGFSDLSKEEIENKDILLIIRRLPSWYYSILWHYNLHTKLNEKGGVNKYRFREVYDETFKNKTPATILIPEITCRTTYPDFKLQQISNGICHSKIHWLRQEHLADDLIKYLKIEDPFVTNAIHAVRKYRHSYNTAKSRKSYYSKKDIKNLYKNNPLWAAIEQDLYENKEQELSLL